MAPTQTKPKKSSATKGRSSSSTKSKAKSSKAKAKSKAGKKTSRPKPANSKRQSSNGSRSSNGSGGGTSPVEAVRNAAGDMGGKAKSAGKSVGKAASKAKVPLVAGGAAVAGAAGGLALAASKHGRRKGIKGAMPRKPKIKLKSGDVAKAAKEVGNFSAQVGELANELQRARESANGTRHRSPVEVVLQGLTARR